MIEIASAQILVRPAIFKQVVDDLQNRMLAGWRTAGTTQTGKSPFGPFWSFFRPVFAPFAVIYLTRCLGYSILGGWLRAAFCHRVAPPPWPPPQRGGELPDGLLSQVKSGKCRGGLPFLVKEGLGVVVPRWNPTSRCHAKARSAQRSQRRTAGSALRSFAPWRFGGSCFGFFLAPSPGFSILGASVGCARQGE